MEELAYLIIIVSMMPLAFFGVYFIMDIIVERIKVKLGNLRVMYRTKNFRMKKHFSKPSGGKIKVGKHFLPFSNDPRFIGFDGIIPVTVYNELGRQVDISDPDEKSSIDPEYFSNLITESYNLGIVSSIKKDRLLMLLVIAAVAAGIAAAAFGFLNWQGMPIPVTA